MATTTRGIGTQPIRNNTQRAVRYFEFLRSALYAKGNFAELTYEDLHVLVHDAKVIGDEMITKEQPSVCNTPDSGK